MPFGQSDTTAHWATFFALQEELAEHLAGQLDSRVERHGTCHARRRPPASLDAYDLYLRGRELLGHATAADTLAAREMLASAIEVDSNFADAYIQQSFAVQRGVTCRWGEPRGRPAAILALQLARRAVEIEPDSPFALACLGFVLALNGEWQDAVETAHAAVLANPCAARTRWAYGTVLSHAGVDHAQAVSEFRLVLSLDPFRQLTRRANLGQALLLAGRLEEALVELRWSAARAADYGPCHRALVIA
ncbi:MAG: hypothetical protein ACREFZ_11230, partial [Acetobacteraceae bacterium]